MCRINVSHGKESKPLAISMEQESSMDHRKRMMLMLLEDVMCSASSSSPSPLASLSPSPDAQLSPLIVCVFVGRVFLSGSC